MNLSLPEASKCQCTRRLRRLLSFLDYWARELRRRWLILRRPHYSLHEAPHHHYLLTYEYVVCMYWQDTFLASFQSSTPLATSLCPFFGHDNSVIVTYRLMTYSFCVTCMYMYSSEKSDTKVQLNIFGPELDRSILGTNFFKIHLEKC